MVKGWHVRVVPLVAGLLVTALGIQLGNWQARRAEEKTQLHERLASAAALPAIPLGKAAADEWQGARLEGEWLPQGAILLDNRVHAGRPGYYALSPLRLSSNGEVVLVVRGWLAAGADRARLPEWPPASGKAMVEGVLRHPERNAFTLSDRPGEGRLWQVLDLPAYRQAFGLAVMDVVVYQTSEGADGLVRDWPRPDAGIDRHRGYALQWYGLAAAAAVMTGMSVGRNWRRKALELS